MTASAAFFLPAIAPARLLQSYPISTRSLDASGTGPDTDLQGYGANFLYFPADSIPGLYGLAGAGAGRVSDLKGQTVTPGLLGPTVSDTYEDGRYAYFQAGVGHLFDLNIGRYEFAIRTEALARVTSPDGAVQEGPADQRQLYDFVFNAGLFLPLGLRPVPPPPPPAPPVEVVAPLSVCADGDDNDGDGKVDYPQDPGCTSADDTDESDPPACSNGVDDDGDGLIDFPDDAGCESADDLDETNPCKAPVVGERISLKGCGTGDILILRGVNFDFDKARLTSNAKTILANVAEELKAYPDIQVELSGHTDARGSDEYNQRLSDRRATSVKQHLVGQGIDAGRMQTVGFGESQPVADNETDEGRELNRRVELKITSGVAAAAGSDSSAASGETFEAGRDADAFEEEAPAAADE